MEIFEVDIVTLICKYHNIKKIVNGMPIFNLTGSPLWKINGTLLSNSSYQTWLHTPCVSGIQVRVNITSEYVSYSCVSIFSDGWMQESNVVQIHIQERQKCG